MKKEYKFTKILEFGDTFWTKKIIKLIWNITILLAILGGTLLFTTSLVNGDTRYLFIALIAIPIITLIIRLLLERQIILFSIHEEIKRK